MRYDWIDSLKGFAILLVVIGHLNFVSNELNQYIYSFHMPLFFFISGYLLSIEKYLNNGKFFLRKKVHSLIVPYFLFSLISYIFYLMMDYFYQPGIQNVEVFREGILFNIYYIICSVSGHLINTPLWFLPCLFMTEILFLVSKKYLKCNYMVFAFILFLSIIGFLYSGHVEFRLPWGIDIAFTGVVFYSAGYFFKKKYEDIFFRTNNSFILVLFLMHLLLSFANPRVDMYNLIYNNYFLFYLSAFSGILAYIYIFKMALPSKLLIFYGENSLIILGFHYLIISVLRYSVPSIFNHLNLHLNENILFIFSTFSTLILMVPIITIINKYFPYVAGKNRQNMKCIQLNSIFDNAKNNDRA